MCVVIVTGLSSSIGSYFSGVFAFFPVASVGAHVLAPLIGLGLGLFAVHLLAEALGVWWSYLIGLAIGVAWNGLLWAWKNRRP